MSTRFMHHTGLIVADIQASIAFYEALGFTMELPAPVTLENQQWIDTLNGGLEKTVMRQMFATLGEGRLEFLQYINPPGERGHHSLRTFGIGNAHIALAVDDVNSEYERLRALDIEFLSKPVPITEGMYNGVTVIYGRDPDGNVFELVSGLGE